MLRKLPQIYTATKEEKRITQKLVAENRIQGIISDNRLGVRNKKVPSVYVTHQINVLTGSTTLVSSKMHQKYIHKFDACWVPDYKSEPTLSGKLGHSKKSEEMATYIGPLSRMKHKKVKIENDILVILSGPEPQRTLLEELLTTQFAGTKKRVLIIQGVVEEKQRWTEDGTIRVVNYLTTLDLEKTINASEVVLCRSGYTSIMDLAALNKKVFFIPTPGQFEQEYLAERLHKQNRVPSCSQDDFDPAKLSLVEKFSGWGPSRPTGQDFEGLFGIF